MAIAIDLDMMLVRRKLTLSALADHVGISIQNLSILKTNKAKAIRFSTLDSLCRALDCQPGDILRHTAEGAEDEHGAIAAKINFPLSGELS